MTRVERERQWRIDHPAEHQARCRRHLAKANRRHQERIAAAKAGGCVDCGSHEELHFHHVDPTTKRYAVGRMNTASDTSFAAEVAKCAVVCQPCHTNRHRALEAL